MKKNLCISGTAQLKSASFKRFIIFIFRGLFITSSTMSPPRHQIHLKLSLQQISLIAPNYSVSSL